MTKNSGIYLLKVKTEDGIKLYIGQAKNVSSRMKQHEKVFGEFERYLIHEFDSYDRRVLDLWECYWIKRFDTFNNGLNKTKGNFKNSSFPYIEFDGREFTSNSLKVVEKVFGLPDIRDKEILELLKDYISSYDITEKDLCEFILFKKNMINRDLDLISNEDFYLACKELYSKEYLCGKDIVIINECEAKNKLIEVLNN